MKRILIALLTVCSALCLFACGKNDQTSQSGEAGDDKIYTVTLVYDTVSDAPTGVGPTEIKVRVGEELTLPTYLDKDIEEKGGYHLECWETEGGKIFLSGVYTEDKNITLKAKWVYYTPAV